MCPVLRRLAAALAGCLALGACMTPTPFGSDVDQRGLNAAALERLNDPSSSDRLTFVALGDSHDAYDELLDAVEAINRMPDVSFVVHTGDVSNYGLRQEFEWTERALSRLRVPALVVIGNHDALSDGKAVYRELFGPFDFSLRWGAYKFVFFNSNALEFPGAAPDRTWLAAELADLEGADFTVLVTHQNPRRPDGPSRPSDAAFYEQLVRANRPSLIVHGHLTHFELETWHQVPRLQLGTFKDVHQFTLVRLSQGQVEIELCGSDGCEQKSAPSLDVESADATPG